MRHIYKCKTKRKGVKEMVEAVAKNVKVVLKLAEGSQTISDCSMSATNDQLFALATAVGTLTKEAIDTVSKVEETLLIG